MVSVAVSLIPSLYLLPGKDKQNQAHKLVFQFDDVQVEARNGIIVSSLQPVAAAYQVRKPALDLGGDQSVAWNPNDRDLNDAQYPGYAKVGFGASTTDLRKPFQKVEWNVTGDLGGGVLSPNDTGTYIVFGPLDVNFLSAQGTYQDTVSIHTIDADGLDVQQSIYVSIYLGGTDSPVLPPPPPPNAVDPGPPA